MWVGMDAREWVSELRMGQRVGDQLHEVRHIRLIEACRGEREAAVIEASLPDGHDGVGVA